MSGMPANSLQTWKIKKMKRSCIPIRDEPGDELRAQSMLTSDDHIRVRVHGAAR